MLRITHVHSQRAIALVSNKASSSQLRHFSPSPLLLDDEAAALKQKEAAAEYNNRRAAYKKQVSLLRKEYASEVALQRASDQAEKAALQKEERRLKLERQRLKNIKAAQNSVRELEKRRLREIEFQEELRVAQEKREARNERFRKARQLVVDELEEEAPLWLTTPEEVEAAFTKASEQELWAFPNSVIGAPIPTQDSTYWNYESYTWHMEKTYRTQSQALAEELAEKAHYEANFDKSYWTEGRLDERRKVEEKAKLRAMVLDAGRRSLLLKQKEMLQDDYPKDGNDPASAIPRQMPVPNVKMLANERALEREGAQVLLKDPTQFFEFSKDVDEASSKDEEYNGPTLGVPLGLRNDVKVEKTLDKAYPDVLGKMPRPDARSAKEKKREQREQAMMAAARAKGDVEVELESADLDDMSEFEEIDLDTIEYEGDEEWAKGLDPIADRDLLQLPRRERYSDEDLDAVIERLDKKVQHLEEELDYELDLARQQVEAGMESETESGPVKSAGYDDREDKFTIEAGDQVYHVADLGVDTVELSNLLAGLTSVQLLALHQIERESSGSFTPDELRKKLSEVPGLTTEQVDAIIQVEETLASNELLAEEKAISTIHSYDDKKE